MSCEKLQYAVMTSSSGRSLTELFAEVCAISGVYLFDIFLLRNIDLEEIARLGISNEATPAKVLEKDENLPLIKKWLVQKCRQSSKEIKIPALATYFPDVTSPSEKRRSRAIRALSNSVRLALELVDEELMEDAIVEMVCGTLINICDCPQCATAQKTPVFIYQREEKFRLLQDSLQQIVQNVGRQAKFALALELEPGETYVLNDLETLQKLFSLINGDAELKGHVGLNVDMAHMKIVPITADQLKAFLPLIVHAHIADHPGMHTRDQSVGAWTEVERLKGGFAPYLRLLSDRLSTKSELPFSKTIALELEGCNRIRWLHNSLNTMKQMTEMTYHSYEALKT